MLGTIVSKKEKLLIKHFREYGLSIHAIYVILKLSPVTVLRIVKACRDLPVACITGPKLPSGRVKKLLRRIKHVSKIKLMKNPYITARNLISKYPNLFGGYSPISLQRHARVNCAMPIMKAAV